MENYSAVPSEFVVGDTLRIEIEGGDYPASIYTLTLTLISPDGKLTATSVADGDNHLLTVDTSALASGRYDYQLQATGEGYRVTTQRGQTEAQADLSAADLATYDGRSHAEKVLDAIEAAIEGRASKTQLSQTVYGVTVAHYTHEQLIDVRDRYKKELYLEKLSKGGVRLFRTIPPRFPA
jgi:hypothetical protein